MLCVCKRMKFYRYINSLGGWVCVCMLLTITERAWVKGETIARVLDFAESCQVCSLLFKKKSPPRGAIS